MGKAAKLALKEKKREARAAKQAVKEQKKEAGAAKHALREQKREAKEANKEQLKAQGQEAKVARAFKELEQEREDTPAASTDTPSPVALGVPKSLPQALSPP